MDCSRWRMVKGLGRIGEHFGPVASIDSTVCLNFPHSKLVVTSLRSIALRDSQQLSRGLCAPSSPRMPTEGCGILVASVHRRLEVLDQVCVTPDVRFTSHLQHTIVSEQL